MPSRDAFFAALGSLPGAIALLTLLRWPQGIAWWLIEAAIGREADRRLSGTAEVDEIYFPAGTRESL